MELQNRIESRTATVAVIGLGYVGLPLVAEMAKAGFPTIGIDLRADRVDAVNRGESYIEDVPTEELRSLVEAGKVRATDDYSVLSEADCVSICVPTPLRTGTKEPDVSYIISAAEQIASFIHREMLIVLESTTYPGTTDEVILPMLEGVGLRAGADFCLAFSPERVDPGNPTFRTGNIPKVVGGITPLCTQTACAFYGAITSEVVAVSDTRAAETVKLLENTFRSVNIALANEMALLCRKLGIDVWEVVRGAASKPFGFMPFYPGPGLGGHCIPIDPYYLTWKARLQGFDAKFIDLAGEINGAMPSVVRQIVADALNDCGKPIKGSRILVLGVAYKKDVSDSRESPAVEVITLLRERGGDVVYHDPYVPELSENGLRMRSVDLSDEALSSADCVVIATAHTCFNYEGIIDLAALVVDTRNATGEAGTRAEHVVKL